MYLPAAHGFDYYLGIPYSDDMGEARATPCSADDKPGTAAVRKDDSEEVANWEMYDVQPQSQPRITTTVASLTRYTWHYHCTATHYEQPRKPKSIPH